MLLAASHRELCLTLPYLSSIWTMPGSVDANTHLYADDDKKCMRQWIAIEMTWYVVIRVSSEQVQSSQSGRTGEK